MRPVRRLSIPQRRRVFLGCEGESEQGYGALLSRLLEQRCIEENRPPDIHLDPVLLRPGGGDPLALVELALRLIAEGGSKRGAYAIQAVLLDADKLGQAPERDRQMREVAATANLRLIWQRPCHEALLLRHLENCHDQRPPTAKEAIQRLTRHWPNYVKGLSAIKLAQRIDASAVRQAALVEPELHEFLDEIGFRLRQ
jgi:hypothetical protein